MSDQRSLHGENACAIVTGASRGIGRAIAERLARDGLPVVVNHAQSETAAKSVVDGICARGGKAIAVAADVSSAAAVTRLFDDAEAAFGGIGVVVANAGILHDARIADMSEEDFDGLLAVNLRGSFLTIREAARRMCEGGRIVTLSSSLVATGRPGSGPYAATKAAIEVLTRTLAKEMGARGITVNCVAPGPVETELFLNRRTPEHVAASAALAPLGRLGQPDDIAGVVATLVGPDGRWINGQTIRVNGGYV